MKIEANVVKTLDTGNTKAIVDVTIDDLVVIHGVKIVKGQNGDFVSMPANTWRNAKGVLQHTDVVHPLTAEARKVFEKAVFDAYDIHVFSHTENTTPFGMN